MYASLDSLAGTEARGGSSSGGSSDASGAGDEHMIGGGQGTVAAWTRPDLVLAAPGGVGTFTPASTVFSAGHTATLVAGQDVQHTAQRHLAVAAKSGLVFYTYAGPVTRLLLDAAKSRKVYESFVAMGMAARHPVVAVDLVGGKKAFRQALIRQMPELSGAPIEQRKIEKAVADEFKRLKVNGLSMEGTQSKRFLLMIDPAEVKGMPAGSKAQAQAQWLAKTIRTPEQIDELNLDKRALKVKGGGKTGLPFAFGALGLLVVHHDQPHRQQDSGLAGACLRLGNLDQRRYSTFEVEQTELRKALAN